MSNRAISSLVWGLLVFAQVAATFPSYAASEASSEAVNPTTRSGVGDVPDLPALPPGKATLLGGTINTVDHLRDRLVLQLFGRGRTVVVPFDDRTRVYLDGKMAALDDLKRGDRIYADTVLDGTKVFARNIRVATSSPLGQSNGQVVAFEPAKSELTFRDKLSPVARRMRLTSDTVILQRDRPALPSELRPGTLVTLAFFTGSDGQAILHQINILASPGSRFAFSGRVEHLDLRRGLLVIVDPRDNKSYEVSFGPAVRGLTRDIQEGIDVTVYASFDGRRYEAESIELTSPSSR